ncbi:type VI secretion system baseplate subunit TssF [Pseudoalteromonas piscicida]|uniref:Type VI secretion system ImpG/VasA family protein n=1 Tax=Pseudoalteromonas piscicida TaxID=43662 RepID=A0A2A5JJU7_PSEO7|nr:type VI secretion system baseplate subunit TssF [Pseudoalteromonas piscicida]PCK29706.1 type VI secretion system ImpG/VasA family protein [Pseudoalteromonas piscicida]
MDMQQYFDAQMRLLTQAGKQFAQQYPEHAGFLNIDALKDRDPHVERLLEGVAYLTAFTQKRLDETLPEVSEQVLRQICPILLNYYPSTTVLEFAPKLTMQGLVSVPKGAEVSSKKSDKAPVACHFTTAAETSIVPFELYSVDYHENHTGATLNLHLKRVGQGSLEDYDLSTLRFYLCGDTPLCASLYQMMKAPNGAIEVETGQLGSTKQYTLNQSKIDAAFHKDSAGILPNSEQSHPAYALLLDYFNSREKFYFVELMGLDSLDIDPDTNTISIKIASDIKLPPGNKVNADNILLNCVPAVNIYPVDAEPIRVSENQTEYQLHPVQHTLGERFCYSVQSVRGASSSTGQAIEFVSRYSTVYEDNAHLYSLISRDIGGVSPQTYIQLSMHEVGDITTLSTDLLAHNAAWPRQTLQESDINLPSADVPPVLSVKNVVRPSKLLNSPEQALHWQLISLLNMRFSQLAEPTQLKKLLALFDWSERSENRNRIESIQGAESKPISLLQRGVFVKGIEIHLTLNEKGFVCNADAYHFCDVLHQFFKLYAPINECLKTRVTLLPSYREWEWDVTAGDSYQV